MINVLKKLFKLKRKIIYERYFFLRSVKGGKRLKYKDLSEKGQIVVMERKRRKIAKKILFCVIEEYWKKNIFIWRWLYERFKFLHLFEPTNRVKRDCNDESVNLTVFDFFNSTSRLFSELEIWTKTRMSFMDAVLSYLKHLNKFFSKCGVNWHLSCHSQPPISSLHKKLLQ